jgi:hypothetical protein
MCVGAYEWNGILVNPPHPSQPNLPTQTQTRPTTIMHRKNNPPRGSSMIPDPDVDCMTRALTGLAVTPPIAHPQRPASSRVHIAFYPHPQQPGENCRTPTNGEANGLAVLKRCDAGVQSVRLVVVDNMEYDATATHIDIRCTRGVQPDLSGIARICRNLEEFRVIGAPDSRNVRTYADRYQLARIIQNNPRLRVVHLRALNGIGLALRVIASEGVCLDLEELDVSDNNITDPTQMLPSFVNKRNIRAIWV